MKPFRSRKLAFAASLSLGTALSTALPLPAAAADAATPATTPGNTMERASALYRQAVLGEGLEALYAGLEGKAAAAGSPQNAAAFLLTRAAVRWQAGDANGAMADTDRAIALDPRYEACLLKARLLDAQGKTAGAATWYRKALPLARTQPERDGLNLRLALIAAMRTPDALASYARSPEAPRDNLATVLALLGRTGEALDLQSQDSAAPRSYADNIRLADWAMAAGRTGAARTYAWSAYAQADKAEDRSYALALVAEAYRKAGDLPDATADLATRQDSPQLEQARVDLLLETGRFDEAIAKVSASRDPQLRRRLPGILDLAGRKDQLIAEYRRLIAAEPATAKWYTALALLYMGQGNTQAAEAVYKPLFSRPGTDIAVLTGAARDMVAMGLSDAALRAITALQDKPAFTVSVGFFLVDTYRAQGEDAKALDMLARLDTQLPPASTRRIDLADSYEALGQRGRSYAILQALERARPALDYDQLVHIARLATETGHDADALARWQKLRRSTDLPARKGYLEKQVIASADKLGQLDAMAGRLDAKLAAGTMGRDDLDLLVAIRLNQRDRAAAVSAVERFARDSGTGDIARLKQLSTVYLRLQDDAGLERTLQDLVRDDPAHAEVYLRQLTLNAVRNPPATQTPEEQARHLQDLLARLDAVAGMDRTDLTRFSAGVYAMASLDDRAIAQYRRLAAMAPDDIDARAQLADTLGKADRQQEAIALLQYAIETQTGEDGFIAAVNTLLDVASQDAGRLQGAGGTQSPRLILAWARRKVLERIARDGEDAGLDTVLADLAQQEGNFTQQLRAYDALLAVAGDQRPTVLRQLVTLTSGSDPSGSSAGPVLGDAARKVAYGRRLLALGREYPPELYADLGRALLGQGDVPGAERAFAMMDDMGGLVNIDQIKGQAYASQGYTAKALDNYSRALLRDRNSLALIVQTSILREQTGDAPRAHDWYQHALERLVRTQPLTGDTGNDTALDVTQYFETLTEGFLLTWPQDDAGQRADLNALSTLFAEAAASAGPAAGQPLAAYPRLALAVRLNRRVAAARNAFGWIAPMEARLARLFPHDPDTLRNAALYRDLVGLRSGTAGAGTDDARWPMQDLDRQAQDTGNAALSLALVLASGDPAAVSALAQQAIAAEAGRRSNASRPARLAQGAAPETPLLFGLLYEAAGWLDRSQVETLILEPLGRTAFHDEALYDLYRAAPSRYKRLEALAGHPLISGDRLVSLITDHSGGRLPLWGTLGQERMTVDELTAAATSRLSREQELALYERLVARMAETGGESVLQGPLVADLLRAPLDAGQQARLAAALEREIDFDRDPQNRTASRIAPKLLVLDALPANRPLLLRAAGMVANRYPDGRDLPRLLESWFAGRHDEAYRLLAALQARTRANDPGSSYAARITRRYFSDEAAASVEDFLKTPVPSQEAAQAFYREHVLAVVNTPQAPGPDDLRRYYEKLLSTDTQNPAWLSGLLSIEFTQGNLAGLVKRLAPYAAQHSDDAEAASVLQIAYLLQGQPQAAQAVASSSGIDVNDPGWLAEMINRSSSVRQTPEPDMRGLFAQLYGRWREQTPQAPVIAQVEQSMARDNAPQDGSATALLAPLTRALARNPQEAASALRGLWRATAEGIDQGPSDLPSRPALVEALVQATASSDPSLLDSMARQPAIAGELDKFLSVMAPDARTENWPLYQLLAALLAAEGQAAPRLARLTASLEDTSPSAHAVRLLTALANRTGLVPDRAMLQRLTARLRDMPALGPEERVALARLYARGGAFETAGLLLEASGLQSTTQYIPADRRNALFAGISAALGQWPDRNAARRTYTRIADALTAQQGGPPLPGADTKDRLILPPLQGGNVQ
ncbi:hypothetical protein [Novosphingobium beihaiensis]|uniref:Tetratricopeptide repeat protein n=1 Tax=Novosphingobium beihaiensis TaxID=2930389 RepID=A0ABT0BL85_9SPHN|nr:hypothetical protein [Novosphingobium beihaiensis]MCJ2185797.1 hypothetical protein [Novosphingobium beihaiensis]